MRTAPQISIIVPVYNKADFLRECLESVLSQESVSKEIVCIDDASTDGSAEILRTYAEKNSSISLLRNEENLGPAKTRNQGIEAARGEYVRFVDADDCIPPESSAQLYSKAVKHKADLARGSLTIFWGNDKTQVQENIRVPDKDEAKFTEEKYLWIPWWHTSYLISRRLLTEQSIRYPELRRGEDPVFIATLLTRARKISLISNLVYWYRKYPKTTGSAGSTILDFEDTLVHAATVKNLFSGEYEKCWAEGYGAYLQADTQRAVHLSALTDSEKTYIKMKMEKIWPMNHNEP